MSPDCVDAGDEVVVLATAARAAIPGPAAIGAVVLDPSDDAAHAAGGGERAHRRDHQQRRRVPRRSSPGSRPRARSPSRAVQVRGDSKLVIEQLAGRWRVKQAHLMPLHAQARALLDGYEERRPRARASRAQHRRRRARERRARPMPVDAAVCSLVRRPLGLRRGDDLPSGGIDYRLIALGSLLPLVVDLAVRLPRLRLHAAVRGRAAGDRDGRHHRSAASAAPPAAVPADRRVLRSRAVGRVHQRRAVLVAVPRHRLHRTTRCCRRRGSWWSRRWSGCSCAGCSSASTTSTCPARAASSSAPAGSARDRR